MQESYLRFLGSGQLRGDDRRAFSAYARRVLRSVIIDSVPAGEDELLQVHNVLGCLRKASHV